MTEGTNSVAKTCDLIKWLIPVISKYPKDMRYSLGKRIENKLFDILELLISANYSKQKLEMLKEANTDLEIIRHLIRFSYEWRLIGLGKYEYISKETNEIGRLIGGWIKQQSVR